jgi:hypothetical protein
MEVRYHEDVADFQILWHLGMRAGRSEWFIEFLIGVNYRAGTSMRVRLPWGGHLHVS